MLTLLPIRTPETLTTSPAPYRAETTEMPEEAPTVHELIILPAPPEDDPIPRLERYTMHSAILAEEREISVYLPEQYASEPERCFPVLYLHDGQNLFDGRKSYLAGRTWRAGETADRESANGATEPVILVGVANTGLRRMAEYTPTRDFKMGGGEGRSYGRLLVEELKPFLDENYRTLSEANDTGLGGSSLGGLISLYLGLEYPGVFGKLAVLSPSIWWDQRSILKLVAAPLPRPELKIWLDIGTAEGGRHVRDTDRLHRLLVERGWRDGTDLAYLRAEGGVHDEDAWAARFGEVLRFLFPAR